MDRLREPPAPARLPGAQGCPLFICHVELCSHHPGLQQEAIPLPEPGNGGSWALQAPAQGGTKPLFALGNENRVQPAAGSDWEMLLQAVWGERWGCCEAMAWGYNTAMAVLQWDSSVSLLSFANTKPPRGLLSPHHGCARGFGPVCPSPGTVLLLMSP